MSSLEWGRLLSTQRVRQNKTKKASVNEGSIVIRNEFESDYDRIIGSSSVRRLQDKAQVFPLQENDVVRTRLTHSIEVSALARSLGKAVGRQLEKRGIFDSDRTDELAALLQVAGLIHDLGNPPFGHYGEDVIRRWFEEWFATNPILSTNNIVFTEQELNDFRYFDGNVQNLRIACKLQTLNDNYGANFTYATLAALMKYPWQSNQRPGGKGKFGYFKSEEQLAKTIRSELGLSENVRHPATYLLEAADDIIYLCDDIEDGAKKGYIIWEQEYETLKKRMKQCIQNDEDIEELFKKIETIEPDRRMNNSERNTAKVRNFRNAVQTHLFKRAVVNFMDNYDNIMSNDYNRVKGFELLDCDKELVEQLKRVTQENCFPCREVLALELVGDKVISTLLDIFVPAFILSNGKQLGDSRTYAGKLFKLISSNFVYVALSTSSSNISFDQPLYEQLDRLTVYERIQLIVDFISGMTDSYAVNIYQELTGIKHP